jgi:hypothetical protein
MSMSMAGPPTPYAATWANVGAGPANVGRQAAHRPAVAQLTTLTGDRWCHPADPRTLRVRSVLADT